MLGSRATASGIHPTLMPSKVDLVNAETELQRSQALSQMEGALSSVYKEWRRSIIKCLANIEAYIDFGEDENVDDNILQESKYIKRL